MGQGWRTSPPSPETSISQRLILDISIELVDRLRSGVGAYFRPAFRSEAVPKHASASCQTEWVAESNSPCLSPPSFTPSSPSAVPSSTSQLVLDIDESDDSRSREGIRVEVVAGGATELFREANGWTVEQMNIVNNTVRVQGSGVLLNLPLK